MKRKSQFSKKAKQQDDKQKLKLLSGDMHPSQVFKKYFLERLTPDPVEMEIAPPAQLFSEIIERKVKITFEVGLRLGRYYGSRALSLVEYQKLYDDQMHRIWEASRSAQFKARKREQALARRQVRQLRAKLLKQLRTKRRSKQ
jgi:plasmid maintenance system antidote protein VapI